MNTPAGDSFFRTQSINSRLKIYYPEKFQKTNSFAEDVLTGLTSAKKFLLPKYFYDENGSRLFEEICRTEEYYPTRAETEILKLLSDTISDRNMDKNHIVELGSGSSEKTNHLLKSFLRKREKLIYSPIDVSNILVESSKQLTEKYDRLFINGILSFYEEGMDLVVKLDDAPKLTIFLGSSIGNFEEKELISFMKMLARHLSKNDRLIIGFDLLKDKKILHAAYNDSKGITAQFNLNILTRINRELDGDFDTGKFYHEAVFNEAKSRIEMYLISKQKMKVSIRNINAVINFEKGERIHTENSYKFTNDAIDKIAGESGMEFSDFYTDNKNYFSLCTFKSI